MTKITLAALQMRSKRADANNNCDKAELFIQKAVKKNTQIIVLPECFNGSHVGLCKSNDYAEELTGYTTSRMTKLSIEYNISIAFGINERCNEEYFSSIVFVGSGEILGVYHKQNPAFSEKQYWKKSKNGPTIIPMSFGKIGIMICYDMMYPNVINDYYRKIDLLLISSSWPMIPFNNIKLQHNNILPRAIAMQLCVPLVYSNFIGDTLLPIPNAFDGFSNLRTQFQGNSMICDNNGEILSSLGKKEGIAISTIDFSYMEMYRKVLQN